MLDQDCEVAMVGDSRNADSTWNTTKTITVSKGLKCPTFVEKSIWLGRYDSNDSFSVVQKGNEITVQRANGMSWQMNLMFICCPRGNILLGVKR